MSKRTVGIAIAVIVLAALGIWGGVRVYSNSQVSGTADHTDSPDSVTPADNTEPALAPTNQTSMTDCVRNFDQTKLPTKVPVANQFVTLQIKEHGTIKVQLYDKDAPRAVENFLRLTHAGFYDCLTFHRVARGFVIQGGDPTGTGSGGMTAFGTPTFEDELNPNTPSFKTGYVKGVLAMANRGEDTNSSQFFITLADLNANLPKNYTIFGQVVEGMEVVEKIGQVPINPGPFGGTDGPPKTPVVIEKATITK
jgi:cyclophilin family peptidyl-prolyl cis-trans isomerase